MENQHRKISGYRELNAEEIDLMNRVKAAGASLLALQQEVVDRLKADQASKSLAANNANEPDGVAELARFNAAEPHRWAAIAKTDIQTGVMALVRAVAQPKD